MSAQLVTMLDVSDDPAGDVAVTVSADWLEVRRVMELVEGEGWCETLPEGVSLKVRPEATLFRFGEDLILARSRDGSVVRMTPDPGRVTCSVEVFDGDGKLTQTLSQPIGGDPASN